MFDQKLIDHVGRQVSEAKLLLLAKTRDSTGKPFSTRTIFVKLEKYIKDHLAHSKQGHPRWIVVPGLRGIGKSTTLAQLYVQLLMNKDIEFIYFSLDEVVNIFNSSLQKALEVYEFLTQKNLATLQKPIFIFLDEVHYDPMWASTMKVLHDKNPQIFVFATGSSALALQKNADIQRRLTIERLYPFSFGEFLLTQHNIWPQRGLKQKLKNIFFNSTNSLRLYADLKLLEKDITLYWNKISDEVFHDYLKYGSIPFANNYSDKTKALEAIYRTIDTVVEVDLATMSTLRKESIVAARRLLFVLANSSVISLRKTSSLLEIGIDTLNEILDAFVRAEILVRIYPNGSVKSVVNKPSKYLFMSSAIRMSILNIIGGMQFAQRYIGNLLEDAVGGYFYKELMNTKQADVRHSDNQEGKSADFIVKTFNNKIAIEIGIGEKNASQVARTVRDYNCSYGITFCSTNLTMKSDNIIHIPLKYFFLA